MNNTSNQFEKEFDFLRFNINLVQEHASSDCIIAFDPSYVSKSGKSTPGVGHFWSGCAGKSKWSLEIGGKSYGTLYSVNYKSILGWYTYANYAWRSSCGVPRKKEM